MSAKSVCQWQQTWRRDGRAGLLSKGPSGSACRLDAHRLARLQDELDLGPAAHGWTEDQRRSLPRITVLIGRLFHVRCTERGVSYLLHRIGWTPRTRLFYRIHVYHARRREPKGLGEQDYIRLLCAVHTQVRAPLIVIWDNLNHHVSAVMRQFVADHDWLTVVQLPAYAPELNPTEGVWSHVKRGLGNLAACGIDQLAAIVRTRLKSLQYRPGLIDVFIAETGLVIQPQPP